MSREWGKYLDSLTRLHPLSVFLLLGVVSAVIYSNTLFTPFEFDDIPNIVENPLIRDP